MCFNEGSPWRAAVKLVDAIYAAGGNPYGDIIESSTSSTVPVWMSWMRLSPAPLHLVIGHRISYLSQKHVHVH